MSPRAMIRFNRRFTRNGLHLTYMHWPGSLDAHILLYVSPIGHYSECHVYSQYSKYFYSKQFNMFRIFYIFNIIGATVSCLALSFATIILLLLRKIRSTRNYIHCNLFLSIIISTIFKTILFIQGHGWIDNIDICAITFLTVYGTILQMTWTLFEGSDEL